MYTQLIKVFGGVPDCQMGSYSMAQQWNMQHCVEGGTDYGRIDPNGIYNVCDYAQETWYIDNKYPINIRASWRQGYDDQSIKIYTEDSIYQWNFGLCPADAYGSMRGSGPHAKTDLLEKSCTRSPINNPMGSGRRASNQTRNT